jgi:ribosome recycling factor
VKLVRGKLEEARVALKGARTKALADIEKSGASEDDEKRLKADVQKIVDDAHQRLEEIAEKKETELKS